MGKATSLIITLTLDHRSHAYFTGLRRQYFPAYCNYLDAHLTLFHRLPADETAIDITMERTATGMQPFSLAVTGLQHMGNGVAFTIDPAILCEMHEKLQSAFDPWLISRDREPLWPHVTIQNKVTAFKAKQTKEWLLQNFHPFAAMATGLSTWVYRNGPWERKADYSFTEI